MGASLETLVTAAYVCACSLSIPRPGPRGKAVPDSVAARKSVAYTATFIGYFSVIIPTCGFGAAALVGREIIFAAD